MADDNPVNPATRRWLTGIFAAVAIVVVSVYVVLALTPDRRSPAPIDGTVDTYNPTIDGDALPETDALVLTGYRFDSGARAIEGSVTNNGHFSYVNVQVHFDLLSDEGTVSGSVGDTTGQLAPGESWLFRIPVTSTDGVAEVRPQPVTGAQREASGPPSSLREARRGMEDERGTPLGPKR